MAKVVIANAVVAGATIAQRLTELNIGYDKVLFDAVGELASTLGYLVRGAEILDETVSVINVMVEKGDLVSARAGLDLVKKGLEEMLSDQDAIVGALATKDEDAAKMEAIEALLKALGAL